jgi:hypothetical protein
VQVSPTWPPGEKRHRLTGVVVVRVRSAVPLRSVFTSFGISMIAWSPASDSLAFSTTGFPSPHQLIVLPSPRAPARVLFSQLSHFDWLSWSPDGRWIVLDDETAGPPGGEWLVLNVSDPRTRIALPRLGGTPTWCCPVGQFTGA